jgi:hypothetical protein
VQASQLRYACEQEEGSEKTGEKKALQVVQQAYLA